MDGDSCNYTTSKIRKKKLDNFNGETIEVQEKYLELQPENYDYDDDLDDSDDSDFETFYTLGKIKNKTTQAKKTQKKKKEIEDFKVSKKRAKRTITCGYCHQPDHNRRNCPLLKSSSQPGTSGLTQDFDELEFVFQEDGIEEPVQTITLPFTSPVNQNDVAHVSSGSNDTIEPPVVRTFLTKKQYEDEIDRKAKKVKLKKTRRTL